MSTYFDTGATTRISEAALRRYNEVASSIYGNSSSSHSQGKQAAKILADSRALFAGIFKVEPNQVIFTSSGTEANNAVITGFALKALQEKPFPEVVITEVEHPCVKNSALALRQLGFKVHVIPVDSAGLPKEASLLSAISSSTGLVSIMHVNNILGTINPVIKLARLVKQKNPSVLFHSDTVQALGRTDPLPANDAVDLISYSSHKIYGPKGIGALIALNSQALSQIRPLILGAGQEFGFRSGTVPVELIASFAEALKHKDHTWKSDTEKVSRLRDQFKRELNDTSNIKWNSPSHSVPHIVSLSFSTLQKHKLLEEMESKGFLISGGAACSSAKSDPDPVLVAIGLEDSFARTGIRVSLSSDLKSEEVTALANALKEAASS